MPTSSSASGHDNGADSSPDGSGSLDDWLVVQRSPIPCVAYDCDGRVLGASESWVAVTTSRGIATIQEWVARTITDDPTAARRAIEFFLGTHGADGADSAVFPSDGEHRVWELRRAEVSRSDDGSWVRMVTATDRTAEHRSRAQVAALELELALRSEELRTLLDVMPIGIMIAHDPEARQITANPALTALLEIGRGANASLSAPEGEAPTNFTCWRGGVQVRPESLPLQLAAREGVTLDNYELDIVYDDGRARKLLEFAAPLFGPDGATRGSIGAVVDITDRERLLERERDARARAELAEARAEALADAGARFAATLDFQTALDTVGRVLVPRLADWAVVDLLEEDRSITLASVAHVDPEKIRWAYEVRRKLPVSIDDEHGVGRTLRTGESQFFPVITTEMIDATITDPQTRSIVREIGYSSAIVVPMISRERVLGALELVFAGSGRHFDESDLRLAEEIADRAATALDNSILHNRIQEALTEVQTALEAKDRFLAILSHELRAPLTPIFGAIDLLQDELTSDASRQVLSVVRRNVELESRLIDDLLDMTHIIRGQLLLTPGEQNVHELISSVAESIRGQAAARGVEIRLEFAADDPMLYVDAARLQQAAWNLIGNALKFTPAGGEIAIRSRDDEHSFTFEVCDTGIGIRQDLLPLIFNPFEQGERGRTRQFGGLGLGLAITRTVVEMHGGTIAAYSEGPDTGARFVVTLPRSGPASA